MADMTEEELAGWTNDPLPDRLSKTARREDTFRAFKREGVKPEELPDLKTRATYKVWLERHK